MFFTNSLLGFDYAGLVDFCEYLTVTWFDDDAKFPIFLWNHFNNRDPRTNNHVKDEETNVALKYSHLKNGTLYYKSRNLKTMENDIKILDLKNQFALKNLTVKEFIFELS